MTIVAEIDESGANGARIAIRDLPLKYHTLAKQLPGLSFSHKDNSWKMPLGWAGCLALRTQFGDDLVIGDSLGAWAAKERATRIDPCMALREALEAPGSPDFYGYQRAGISFMAHGERVLLADEMGTGKTRQAIGALMKLYQDGENPFPVLVVAPNSTKISWKREAEIVWPGLAVTVIKGGAAERRKQLEEPAHIYIMNWESLRGHSRLAPYGSISLKKCVECGGTDERVKHTTCETHSRELNQIDFRTVIGDEIHRAKDPKSKQTRALWAATADAPFRFALSGTPIANDPSDLWSVLHWLSPEEWPSKTKFIERMCEVSYNAFGAATVIGIKRDMEAEFFAALDPRLRRMPKDLVLSFLPPVVYERRDVEMPPKQKKAYEQMRDQMIAELDDSDRVATTSPLTKVMRMLQFASSYATIERKFDEGTGKDKESVVLADPSCKLDAFMDDLEDFGDNSVVVFAVSRQLINMLSARLTKRGIAHGMITGEITADERQNHMDDFQAGRVQFMLCTIAAGGTGITLTKGSIGVFLQRSWSMIENHQAEARVHRIGSEQHETIQIIDYVTADTIEEVVISAVEKKTERLERILRDKQLLAKAIQNAEDVK